MSSRARTPKLVAAGVVAAAVAGAALLLTGASASPVLAETIVYGSHLPAAHRLHGQALQPFFRQAERATRNGIRFDLRPAGAVASAGTVPEALRQDALGGGVFPPRAVADLPVAVLLAELARTVDDPRIASAALNEVLQHCEPCLAAFAGIGIRPLVLAVGAPPLLHCRRPPAGDAAHPETRMLRGLHIAAEVGLQSLLGKLAAEPVETPALVVSDRLIDGRIDCAAAPAAMAAELWDTARQVTALPGVGDAGLYLVAFSRKRWDGFSAAERRTLATAAPVALRGAVQSAMIEAATLLALASMRGVVVHPAPPELADRIAALQDAARTEAGVQAARRGFADAPAIVDRFRDAVDKWRRLAGDDFDRYETDLRREIYSAPHP